MIKVPMNGEEKREGPAPLPDSRGQSPGTPPFGGFGAPGQPGPSIPPPIKSAPPLPPPPPPPPPPPRQAGIAGAPPPPPAPEVDIRTMASDAKSLRSTGGVGAEPKIFRPSDFVQATGDSKAAAAGKSGSGKRVAAIIAAATIMLGAAAAAVYFFVLPLFSPEEPPAIVVPDVSSPPPPPAESPPALFEHQSFFVGSADFIQNVELTAVNQGQISAGLQSALEEAAPAGSLQEIAFQANGAPVRSSEFIAAFLPNSGINGFFEEDFTAFVYYDDDGAWPGYIFLLAGESDAAAAEVAVRDALEGGTNLAAFYLGSPGNPESGGFRDGSVGGVATRYLPYSGAGASFNYGWSGNYLILSTSFAGFGEATGLLP